MSDRWDRHFFAIARANAAMSKDPSTRVGAVIVRDRIILSGGFNGLPQRLADAAPRLENRSLKYALTIHAEMNAVLLAALNGISIRGGTIYVVAFDAASGESWGGPPCTRCAVELIQAGISECVYYPRRGDSAGRWLTDQLDDGTPLFPEMLFEEAGVTMREIQAS